MNERFSIKESTIIEGGFFIHDGIGTFTFPTTTDKSSLITYLKALNSLSDNTKEQKMV